MIERRQTQDRPSLLADVAEMYYLEEKNQAEIARLIGVTRSMVSRLLTEARQKGIIEISIHRLLQANHDLEAALVKRFDLRSACVAEVYSPDDPRLLQTIGRGGAQELIRYLTPNAILGLAWGTSVSATVDAVDVETPIPVKIVQLVGALGARNNEYDGHGLVSRLAEKLGGECYFLNAPFFCQSPEIVHSLLATDSIRETVIMGKKANVALLGVGTTMPDYSSFYLAGYVPLKELEYLHSTGAVGDVCGLHFDIHGNEICNDLCTRMVTIQKEDLLAIPTRIGVAGGGGKAEPILGALRIGYINALVTDQFTAKKVLQLAENA